MNSEMLVQHLAQLETELMLKDTALREKESELNKIKELGQYQSVGDTRFHDVQFSLDSRSVYHQQLMVRKLVSAREKIIHEVATLTKDVEVKAARQKLLDDQERRHEGELSMLRLQLHLRVGEVQAKIADVDSLRRIVCQKEADLVRLSNQLTVFGSELDQLLRSVSESLVSGVLELTVVGRIPHSRLVCFGLRTIRIYSVQNHAVEMESNCGDVRASKISNDNELIIQLVSLKDNQEYRISVPLQSADKWEWAFEKMFNHTLRRASDPMMPELWKERISQLGQDANTAGSRQLNLPPPTQYASESSDSSDSGLDEGLTSGSYSDEEE